MPWSNSTVFADSWVTTIDEPQKLGSTLVPACMPAGRLWKPQRGCVSRSISLKPGGAVDVWPDRRKPALG